MADPVTADVQRVVQDWLERPGATTAELAADMQRLIADAEKRAAAAARDHGRMVGAYETFASLASNLRHGTTFTAEDMDRLAAEYRAAALDPAGAASGETT